MHILAYAFYAGQFFLNGRHGWLKYMQYSIKVSILRHKPVHTRCSLNKP
jgi:hypothetical protein